MMIVCCIIIACLLGRTLFLCCRKQFGKTPSGERLNDIKKSDNYREGCFHNEVVTNVYTKEFNVWKLLDIFLSKKNVNCPNQIIPGVKSDLKTHNTDKTEITWFGHSSYLITINGYRVLVDPVMSKKISPLPGFDVKGFPGSFAYSLNDLPEIDAVIISHDHYDHLDYNTIKWFKKKSGIFYVPLGVGSHLEYWGIEKERIVELDWWHELDISEGIRLIAAPARHFSGRGLRINKTFWASYVIKTNKQVIYLGGDSGYGPHFREIGMRLGPFDLVILECGQYGDGWPNIHMMPEQVVQAAIDLNGHMLLPVHWGRFALAFHAWNEPIERLLEIARANNVSILGPVIGEKVVVGSPCPLIKWWN